MARTQQQRREETVARLLDASIDTIVEVGYARASAAVIAKRAQVSDGALFRHFPTMGDFMAATAHEVMRRQLDLFTKRVAEIPADKPALEAAVKIHWDVSANATNTVMFELLVAARTDEKLRVTLQDVIVEYAANILDTAKALPGADQFPEGTFAGLVAILTNSFIGTAIVRAVLPQPEMEERQIQLLTELLGGSRLTLLGHLGALQGDGPGQSRILQLDVLETHVCAERGERERDDQRIEHQIRTTVHPDPLRDDGSVVRSEDRVDPCHHEQHVADLHPRLRLSPAPRAKKKHQQREHRRDQ